MKKAILRLKNGNVELMNTQGQKTKTYYRKGDATRADWYDEEKGSVSVQLVNGDVLIINRGCQITKRIR